MTRPSREFTRFTEFVNTSRGTLEISVIGPLNLLAQDQRVIRAIESWRRNANHKSPGNRPLCLCCDTEFAGSAAKGIIPVAFAEAKSSAFVPSESLVVSGLCEPCFASDDLRARMLRSWRDVLPDLREIEGGRA
jgi:hypothetical protein